jgi:hypothetical protein
MNACSPPYRVIDIGKRSTTPSKHSDRLYSSLPINTRHAYIIIGISDANSPSHMSAMPTIRFCRASWETKVSRYAITWICGIIIPTISISGCSHVGDKVMSLNNVW